MINVIGMGYIGLPTALMLSTHGNEVVGTDYNDQIINQLKKGNMTFEEDGMESLFQKAIREGLVFSTEYQCSDQYVVAVPTPYLKENKKVDATYLINAVDKILDICLKPATIIIESTVSPGTIENCIKPLVKKKGYILEEDIYLVHAPERIIPGNMLCELVHNSRTIGCDNRDIGEKVKKLYESFCTGEIVLTDIKSAEMTKVVENAYRDINIAFANELAKICRLANMDVCEIIRIANKHPRVNILKPGPGVGGHCIAVDPWFLVGDFPDLTHMVRTARETNDAMPEYVLKRIYEVMKKHNIFSNERIGLYGLSYKEEVDDTRESPTLQLLECMKNHLGEGLKVYDPFVKKDIVENQYHDFDEFISDIDMIVIMVAHNHIKERLETIKDKVILDTRYINIDNIDVEIL